MRAIRSLLFVPGDSARKFEKARASGADALILDLEDSVASEAKPGARKSVQAMLGQRGQGQTIFVRVNALATGLILEDLGAVVGRCDGIMLPKCSGAADVARLSVRRRSGLDPDLADRHRDRRIPIWPCPVSAQRSGPPRGARVGRGRPRGRHRRFQKAGTEWIFQPLSYGAKFMSFRRSAAGLPAIDTVYTDIPDLEGLLHEAEEARADGFQAKLAIHPTQIETINKAFSVTPEERAWAEGIVAAFAREPGKGALRVGDQMVDVPHLRLAEKILARP
jgi:citrate lyase subunit beta / citryl-CoA lyase